MLKVGMVVKEEVPGKREARCIKVRYSNMMA